MQAGEVIGGRFRLGELIGSGGVARVHRATDLESGDVIAVKLLDEPVPDDRRRFVREAKVLKRLAHPAIVGYVAHGVTSTNELYLAMEWVDGGDLAGRLAGGPLTVGESLLVGRRLAEALAAAHAAGVVHRDVKPGNVLLPGGDVRRAMLADFGIARVDDATRRLTATAMTIGTPGYMAPEQARGDADVDARADVFSLGAVLFECLTGKPAFTGDHMLAILAKILLEDAPRVGSVRDDLQAGLDALVATMLAKDREARPESCAEVAEALAGFEVGEVPAPAKPKGAVRHAVTPRELRVVSLVLVGSARDADPDATFVPVVAEEMRARVEAVARQFGARLEHLAGGALVAVLSRQQPVEQAVGAARCALELAELVPDRAVVVVTGRTEANERTPLGEAIDQAVEMMARVEPGSVHVDPITARLVEGRFALEPEGAGLRLAGESEVTSPRTLLGAPSPFVGRDREATVLEVSFRAARDEGSALVAIVTAEAGAGKSRLAHELVTRLGRDPEPPRIFVGRGDELTADTGYALAASVVRPAFALSETSAGDAGVSRIRTRLESLGLDDEAPLAAGFLAILAGLAPADTGHPALEAARYDPALLAAGVRDAFARWLSAEAARAPLLLVLDDLHWADLLTIELVDRTLERLAGAPLMVLGLARPEAAERFPDLWSRHSPMRLPLKRLPAKAARSLAARVLDRRADDPEVLRICERADGNAFCLEELIRMVADGGQDTLPTTVLGMAQSRLDGLPKDARMVLRAASVLGMEAPAAGIAALVGADGPDAIAPMLETLTRGEVLERRGAGRFEGGLAYGFRHALLRDAAYATLAEADRKRAHRAAAEFLESHGERDAARLAHHLELGDAPAEAARFYARAALDAVGKSDLEAGLSLVARGRACTGDADLLATFDLLEGRIRSWQGDTAGARTRLESALSVLPESDARWFHAVGTLLLTVARLGDEAAVRALAGRIAPLEPTDPDARVGQTIALCHATNQLVMFGDYAGAGRALARAEEAGEGLGEANPIVAGRLSSARAFFALFTGRLTDARRYMGEAVAAFERAGDAGRACNWRVNLAAVLTELGDYEGALAIQHASLEEAGRLGLSRTAAMTRQNMGDTLGRLGRHGEALSEIDQAIAWFDAHDDLRFAGNSWVYRAMILLGRGDARDALVAVDEGLARLEAHPPARCLALSVRARALVSLSRVDEAVRASDEASALLEQLGSIEEGENIVRVARIETLVARGAPEAADATREALHRLAAQVERIEGGAARRTFLGKVEANVRILSFAREMKLTLPSTLSV